MARQMTNRHVGSDFGDFLGEEGRQQESTALAIERVQAWTKAGLPDNEVTGDVGQQVRRGSEEDV